MTKITLQEFNNQVNRTTLEINTLFDLLEKNLVSENLREMVFERYSQLLEQLYMFCAEHEYLLSAEMNKKKWQRVNGRLTSI